MSEVRSGARGTEGETPNDLTRRLLRPRLPGPSVPNPPHNPAQRPGWRFGAVSALLAGIAAAGASLWHSASRGPTPDTSPAQRQPLSGAPAKTVAVPAVVPLVAVPVDPLRATAPLLSLSELLQRPASAQPRWSRLKTSPAIVAIEYPDLRTQGFAMNRLAALYEKRAAQRDRILTEGELEQLMRRSGDNVATFYQGHDYPARKVARFFSQAEAQGVALNAQETQLRSFLSEAGLMRRGAAGAWQALGEQAVISFTGVQDDPGTRPDEKIDSVRREAVLRHELSHGEFFVNSAYRAHCMNFWRHVLSKEERRMFIAYLKSLDYDPRDEELMANETQALLMHTPDSRAFGASSVGLNESALARLRDRFRAGEPLTGLKR